MKLHRYAALPLLLALAACNRGGDEGLAGLDGIAERTGADIREHMATESITLRSSTKGAPRAEITPQGDLLIGGEKVALNANQRALLIDYREQLAGLAQSGAQVGLQGAELAGTAVTELAKAAFSGDMDKAEKRIEEQAEGIEAAAQQLCDQVPRLRAAEQKLAVAVPQFAPYATIEEKDGDDCDNHVVQR